MRSLHAIRVLALISFVAAQNAGDSDNTAFVSDPASLVNLFIGTTNGGNVFPGTSSVLSRLIG